MELLYIGWCKTDNHDKVWGILLLDKASYPAEDTYITFWGRRGGKLQTNLWRGYSWHASNLFDTKRSRGYSLVDVNQLNVIYPEFQQDLEKTAFWATLRG